jgi:hypothetical protein
MTFTRRGWARFHLNSEFFTTCALRTESNSCDTLLLDHVVCLLSVQTRCVAYAIAVFREHFHFALI